MGAAVAELPDGAAEPDSEPLEREKPPPPVAVGREAGCPFGVVVERKAPELGDDVRERVLVLVPGKVASSASERVVECPPGESFAVDPVELEPAIQEHGAWLAVATTGKCTVAARRVERTSRQARGMSLTLEREYLTVAEAAGLWRVSVPTIYRRCADGSIPHIRVGGDGPIRILAEAFEVPDRDGERES
jgi:excisionase family DNA binding protein